MNASRWDCALEPTDRPDHFAVRLGLLMVKGRANTHAAALVASRGDTPFPSVDDLWRRAGVPPSVLMRLAEADAFRPSLGLARCEALWAIKALRDTPLPLFAAADAGATGTRAEAVEPPVALQPMDEGAEVVQGYWHSGLPLRAHPVSFLRAGLAHLRIVPCGEAMDAPDGRTLTTAGIVLVRQVPGSAKGVLLVTIEDETGVANLGHLAQALRPPAAGSSARVPSCI